MSPPKPTQRPPREHRWSTTENARLGAATCSPRSGRTAGVAEKSSLRSGPRPAPEQLGAQSPAVPAGGVSRGPAPDHDRSADRGDVGGVRGDGRPHGDADLSMLAVARLAGANLLAVKGEPAPSNRHDQLYVPRATTTARALILRHDHRRATFGPGHAGDHANIKPASATTATRYPP